MTDQLSLEVVTPERIVLSEDNIEMVVSPGELGDFGVLKGHTPFLTSLKTGILRYTLKDKGEEKIVFIKGGFAEALPDKVTILADAAELKEDIDLERAENAKERALERLNNKDDKNIDHAKARKALLRAEVRLRMLLQN